MGLSISVREMLPSEERTVKDLFKSNLGLIDRVFFLSAFSDALKSALEQKGTSLVAVCDEKIVGSVSLRIVVYAGKRIGLVDAIVTDKSLRGRGVGKSLLDGALSWFEGKACEIICATADRYNSPSWNMFIHKGFSVYETLGQLRDLGLGFIRLWFAEFNIVGAGTFFLKKTIGEEKQSEDGEVRHFLTAWVGLALIWCVLVVRGGASFALVPLLFGVVGLSLFAHESAHRFAASRFSLETTFRAWDSGLLFSSFLAAILGAFYPSYGSTYVKQVDWRYGSKRREMGLIYTTGPAASLALAALFLSLLSFGDNQLLTDIWRVGYVTNLVVVIFNLIPIQVAGGFAWDGRKIFIWNKIVWTLLTIGVVLLTLGDVFL